MLQVIDLIEGKKVFFTRYLLITIKSKMYSFNFPIMTSIEIKNFPIRVRRLQIILNGHLGRVWF